jgi:hypothetical protein
MWRKRRFSWGNTTGDGRKPHFFQSGLVQLTPDAPRSNWSNETSDAEACSPALRPRRGTTQSLQGRRPRRRSRPQSRHLQESRANAAGGSDQGVGCFCPGSGGELADAIVLQRPSKRASLWLSSGFTLVSLSLAAPGVSAPPWRPRFRGRRGRRRRFSPAPSSPRRCRCVRGPRWRGGCEECRRWGFV